MAAVNSRKAGSTEGGSNRDQTDKIERADLIHKRTADNCKYRTCKSYNKSYETTIGTCERKETDTEGRNADTTEQCTSTLCGGI